MEDHHFTARRKQLYLLLWITPLCILAAWFLIAYPLAGWAWTNLPIHATVESVGSLAAILLALFMFQREHDEYSGDITLAATGLLCMGLLDGLHGMLEPGVDFVFLHSLASLLGGFWFALVWLPRSASAAYAAEKRWLPWLLAIATILFGIATLIFAASLPAMVIQGTFTVTAITINVGAGVLFLLAIPRFALNFYRSGQSVFFLLLCLTILFGLSELTFQYSALWDGGWWLWHMLRLCAFLIALWFMARSFQQVVAQQRAAQEELRQHRDSLEQVVQARTQELEIRTEELRQNQLLLQTAVSDFSRFAERVAQGDLTTRLQRNGHDDLGTLALNLNSMVEHLSDMTSQTRAAAANITSVAAAILAATTQQSSGAAEQSAAITQTTTTIEQVKTIAQQTAQQATRVAHDSQHALQVARQGTQTVEDTIAGMHQIRQRVEGIAQTILALSEKTQAIGAIITTVSEIADQSNLLALNAAIEAARAGSQGRSFAVVAQHVRDLAERSKAATVQVQEILGEIQRAANTAVLVTEEGTKGVEAGTRLASEAGQMIHRMAAEVETGAQANMQMAAAAQQQTAGVEQVGQAMRAIQQATAQALTSTRQAERAAQELHTLAQSLQRTIEAYQL